MKTRNQKMITNYKKAFVAYIIVFATLISPYWAENNVLTPHLQNQELRAQNRSISKNIENHKFSDVTNAYIPEINEHLISPRSGWIATWSNNNELGRPLYHLSGFSPAYLLTRIAMLTGSNPWKLLTIFSLFNIFVSGAFIILYCREIQLIPLAGLISGLSIAFSPTLIYWMSFPMFTASWCWGAGTLYGIERLARKKDAIGWLVLSFSVHSLIMTGYPQILVYHIYVFGVYTFCWILRKWKYDKIKMSSFILLIASSCLVGLILSLPVIIDLAITAEESARGSTSLSFFTSILPTITNAKTLLSFYSLSSVPELFGNPISPTYPFIYNGLSISITTIFFITSSSTNALKKAWYWWLITTVILILTFSRPIYSFAVMHMHLNLSRSIPLGILVIPLAIITGYSVQSLAKINNKKNARQKKIAQGLIIVAITTATGILYGLSSNAPVAWLRVISILALCMLLLTNANKHKPMILLTTVVANIMITTYPMLLKQKFNKIVKTSPLIEKIRTNIPSNSRYAVSDPGIEGLLPPNINATLGLKSIHTYNSLSSTKYHKAIKGLGGKTTTYGRHNTTINPNYSTTEFWMSNIGLILSQSEIRHKNLELIGVEAGVYLHKNATRMGESIQLVPNDSEKYLNIRKIKIDTPSNVKQIRSTKIADLGDLKTFKVASTKKSILLLSQRYHHDWKASTYTDSDWTKAKTIEFNGTYQGVLLPPNTTKVQLEFKPFVSYAWISHVVWLVASMAAGPKIYKSLSDKTLNHSSKVNKKNSYIAKK